LAPTKLLSWALRVRSCRAPLTGFLLILVFCAGAGFGQRSELTDVAANLAAAINDASFANATAPTVRVEDFHELHGTPSQLGPELADEFTEALLTSHRNFTVRERGREASAGAGANPPADPFKNPKQTTGCERPQQDATFMVEGEMDDLPDRIVLRVKATRKDDGKVVFDHRISLPLNSMMSALASKPRNVSKPAEDAITWIRPGYVSSNAVEDEIAKVDPEARGFMPPSCAYCPRADYPDAAMGTKIQGVVKMKMLVSKDGDPLKLIVLQGLPCGLTQAALETVARWRLKPAKAPDDTPIAVWQELEVTFQLY
jgi:TonB family protein